MARRLPTILAAGALASTLVLSGCGDDSSDTAASSAISAVTVSGSDPKAEPTVTVDAPVTVTKTESKVVTEGTGAAVGDDELVSIQAVIVNGKDGKVATSTWEQGPVGLDLGDENLFASFRGQLPGQKIGSRLIIASTPEDAFGEQGNTQLGIAKDDPVLFVVDVVGASPILSEADGTAVAPKKGLPTVTMNEGKPATITIPKGFKAPKKTIVQQLVQGEGAEVKDGQTVRVTYTGALLKDGSVFDSSASRPEQPYFEFSLGQGGVIPAWDTYLKGQKVGSRVLLVVPPAEGYGEGGQPPKIAGDDTLLFVIDIVAAY